MELSRRGRKSTLVGDDMMNGGAVPSRVVRNSTAAAEMLVLAT